MNVERLEALVAEAKQAFREQIIEERPKLAALARSAENGSQEAMSLLHQAAHQINGTAGTLGFTAASDAARALEALTDPQNPTSVPIGQAWRDLEAALAALEAV